MDLQLREKVALVAGGSRGIGLAISRVLAQEGCSLVLNSRGQESLMRAASELDALALPGDIQDPEFCQNLAKQVKSRFGKLDILVCCVGSGTSVLPGNETPEEWKRVFDLNFFSSAHLIGAMRPLMVETGGGAIVCISSICGLEALGAPVTYSAAKSALNAMIRGLARPLAKEGIRINAVAPGNILFEGGVWDRKLRENAQFVSQMLEREVALQRLGTPGEIANWVAFLCSARASFATGSVYVVDGGQVRG